MSLPAGDEGPLLAALVLSLLAGRFIARSLRLPSRSEMLLAAGLVTVALVVATTLVLGAGFAALTPGALLVAAGCEALLAIVASVRVDRRLGAARRDRPVGARAWARAARNVAIAIAKNPLSVVFAAGAGGQVLWRGWLAANLPVKDFDGLSYHVTMAGTWVQNRQVSGVTSIVWANSYPGNLELVSAWVMAFLQNDSLADAIQIPFVLLGALAVFVAGRLAGLSRPSALTAGCIWALTPIVLAQSITAYIDVAGAALLLSGVCFLAAAVAQPGTPAGVRIARLALGGTGIGLTIGAKASYLQLAALGLVALLAYFAWQQHDGVIDRRRLAAFAAAIFIPVAAFGSFFYLRNTIVHRNPVYPIDFGVGPVTLVHGKGTVQEVVLGTNVPPELRGLGGYDQVAKTWFENRDNYTYDERMGGLGPQWGLFLLPATAAAVVLACRRRQAFFLCFAGPLFASLFLMPASWWSRYTIHIVAPGAIAALLVLDTAMGGGWRRLLRPVARVVLAALVGLGAVHATRQIAVGGQFLPASQLHEFARSGTFPGDIVTYPEFEWMRDIPTGSVIAIPRDGFPLVSPFMGHDLQFRVVGIDVGTLAETVAELRRAGADYFVAPRGDPSVGVVALGDGLPDQVQDPQFSLVQNESYQLWVWQFTDSSGARSDTPDRTVPAAALLLVAVLVAAVATAAVRFGRGRRPASQSPAFGGRVEAPPGPASPRVEEAPVPAVVLVPAAPEPATSGPEAEYAGFRPRPGLFMRRIDMGRGPLEPVNSRRSEMSGQWSDDEWE